MVRWSKEPRKTSAGEQSWDTNLAHLWVAWFVSSITMIQHESEPSQYILQKTCSGTPMLLEASGGRLGRGRSIPQTATHRAYEDKELG
jgi:hypothetical protein